MYFYYFNESLGEVVSWIFILVSVEALTVPWLHLNEIMKMERDYLRIIHHKRRK